MIDFINKQKEKISIIVFCVDRLQRDFDSMSVINKMRKAQKIEVCFVKDGTILNKYSDSSILFRYGLDVLLGNDSPNRTGERVRIFFQKKLEEGTILGPAPLGYYNKPRFDKKKEKAVVYIDESKACYIRKIFEIYSTGAYSMEDIKNMINKEGLKTKNDQIVAKSQIENIISNPFYCGFIKRKNGDLYPHIYEKLITKELFDACQDIKNGKKKVKYRKTLIPFVLRGMLICKHCNCAYSPELHKNKYVYMRPTKSKGNCNICVYVKEETILEQLEIIINLIKIPEDVFNKIKIDLKLIVQSQVKIQIKELDNLKNNLNLVNQRLESIRYKFIDGKITDE